MITLRVMLSEKISKANNTLIVVSSVKISKVYNTLRVVSSELISEATALLNSSVIRLDM